MRLPDHPRLLRELRLLERRPHGRTGSDDYANAVFGVMQFAQRKRQRIRGYTLATPGVPSVELDLSTGRPMAPPRTRVVFRTYSEQGVLLKESFG